MATLNGHGKKSSQEDVAYEYLCRLEEAKKWIESVIHEELPPATELEDSLQNGVYLCKLGMTLLPDDNMWKKVYDLDQSKFKAKGLDYRYTDNINFWLSSLSKLGLPKVFYPVMTDIFHKKDMPKLIYCLHALSHLMKRKGLVIKAVDDLFGSANFSHDAVVQTRETLQTIRYYEMPAFGVVENLVEEELQYQAMGLCDSYEEEPPLRSPSFVVNSNEEALKFFDDPTYVLNTGNKDSTEEGKKLIELLCANKDFKVTLFAHGPLIKDELSPVELVMKKLNEELKSGNQQTTFEALRNAVKLVDVDNSVVLFQSYADRYYKGLIKEKKEGLPSNVLPVYSGLDRAFCDNLLENMSPGAFLIRNSTTIEGAYVLSFRNNTGIKHWKLSTKNGKFYWGNSSLHSSLDAFVQVMDSLHKADEDLSYGQMCRVIKDVNNEARMERKTSHNDAQIHVDAPPGEKFTWDSSMIIKVRKVEAEKLLNTKGEKGSFLVRPSERTVGDYALAFRTKTDLRHWRIVSKNDKFYVHPRPNPYNSLDDIIAHFQEAVGQETGLTMTPLKYEGSSGSSILRQESLEEEYHNGGGGILSGGGGVGSALRTPVVSSGPSQSMSRLNPSNLTSWSVDDVCFWLISQSLGNFVDVFKDNEVDGECLLTLDNKLLKDDLGIMALGHRSRIMKRVEALKNEFHPN